jgi:glycosyltransferase involved in cell wall biosynthesis
VAPLVSIIVPTYNKAQFLRESLLSAIKQDYPNTEILVVNDGSTDNSSDVARQVMKEFPLKKIELLEKPNGGISDARNYGIARSRGEILMCLDGDDIALPSFLSKAVALHEGQGAKLVHCLVELFGEKPGEWIPQPYDRFGIRYNNNIPTLVTYTRKLYDLTGGYSRAFPFNEDWDFFIKCSMHKLVVRRIDEKLFRYRVTANGLAEQYIKDSYDRSVSMMVTSNSSLYSVEQCLAAHSALTKVPQSWADKVLAQDKIHQREWLLKFWLGILMEATNQLDIASNLYHQAHELAEGTQWQPLFRLGILLEKSAPKQALQAFHIARTERPDADKVVRSKINELMELLKDKPNSP